MALINKTTNARTAVFTEFFFSPVKIHIMTSQMDMQRSPRPRRPNKWGAGHACSEPQFLSFLFLAGRFPNRRASASVGSLFIRTAIGGTKHTPTTACLLLDKTSALTHFLGLLLKQLSEKVNGYFFSHF